MVNETVFADQEMDINQNIRYIHFIKIHYEMDFFGIYRMETPSESGRKMEFP